MRARGMERKEIVKLEDVFPYVVFYPFEKGSGMKDILGDTIKMDSLRYQLFKTKGCKCVSCGVEGTYFAKERNGSDRYHLNLYGKKDGKEVMLTKGRRVDPAEGAFLENLEPLCELCLGKEQAERAKK